MPIKPKRRAFGAVCLAAPTIKAIIRIRNLRPTVQTITSRSEQQSGGYSSGSLQYWADQFVAPDVGPAASGPDFAASGSADASAHSGSLGNRHWGGVRKAGRYLALRESIPRFHRLLPCRGKE